MTSLVFLPGTLCDERLFKYQIEKFPNAHVVNLRTQNTLDEMIETVTLVPYEKFVIVGFSMGGSVAQEFTLKYPARVQHLVVIGSSALGYPAHEREIVLKAKPMIDKGLFKGITERRLKEFLHPKNYERKELRDLIQDMAGADAAAVYSRQLNATLDRPDTSDRLHQLHCPLTAIGGLDDRIVPADSIRRYKDFYPASDVIILEECGHFVPLEKPDELNRILNQTVQP